MQSERSTYSLVDVVFGKPEGLLDLFNVGEAHGEDDGQALVLVHFTFFDDDPFFPIDLRKQ